MDVIAGQPVLETEVKQHSAKFKLDYSQACLASVIAAASAREAKWLAQDL